MSPIAAAPDAISLVVFSLDGEPHAVATSQVREVVLMVAMGVVPGAPEWVAGRVNFRGQPIVVVDLRRRLGFPSAEYGLSTPIIIARTSAGATIGLVADRIDQLDELPGDAMSTGPDDGLVSGVARDGARLINVLDIDAVVAGADRLHAR